MTRLALIIAALLLTGCHSPISPSATCTTPSGPLTLRVLVAGHGATNGPIAGVPVSLVGYTCQQVTGADGLASWHVEPGQRVTILIRGEAYFRDKWTQADAQWLISFPE